LSLLMTASPLPLCARCPTLASLSCSEPTPISPKMFVQFSNNRLRLPTPFLWLIVVFFSTFF
jgi:hypothetical protein